MKLLKYALLIMLGVSIQDIAAMKALVNKQRDVMMQQAVAVADSIINDIETVKDEFGYATWGSKEATIRHLEDELQRFKSVVNEKFSSGFPQAKNEIARLNNAIQGFETTIEEWRIKVENRMHEEAEKIKNIYRQSREQLEAQVYDTEALINARERQRKLIEGILNNFHESEQEEIKKEVKEEEEKFLAVEAQAYRRSSFMERYGRGTIALIEMFIHRNDILFTEQFSNLSADQQAVKAWKAVIESAKQEIDNNQRAIDDMEKEIKGMENREDLNEKKLDLESKIAKKKMYIDAMADYIINVFEIPPLVAHENAETINEIKKYLPNEKNESDRLNKDIRTTIAAEKIKSIYRQCRERLENYLYYAKDLKSLLESQRNHIEGILKNLNEAEREAIKEKVKEEEEKFLLVEKQAHRYSSFMERYGDEMTVSIQAFIGSKARPIRTQFPNLSEDDLAVKVWNAVIESAKKEIERTQQVIDLMEKEIKGIANREDLNKKKLNLESDIADKKKHIEAMADYIINVYPIPPSVVNAPENAQTISKIKEHLPKSKD